jgi:hypothetical protein
LNASHDHSRFARRQRLAQRLERDFSDVRIFLHQTWKQNRAPQLHDHGYLAYALHRGPTKFENPQWFRPIYLTILLTHTVLAIVIVPLILITLNRARRQNFEAHKKIARWTWPLWMYVSVTGVIVYLLLYQIFPQK